MTVFLRILTVLIFVTLPQITHGEDIAQSDALPLSLQSAIEHTLKTNPDLYAAKEEYNAVYETLDQALSGWRPTITADGNITNTEIDTETGANTSSQGQGSTSKGYGISLEQPLFRGGRTLAETEAAKATIAAQKAHVQNTEQEIILSAATAYMNVVRDKALLKLAQNNFGLLNEQNIATQERFEVGELTRTDTSQAEARLAQAKAEIVSALGQLEVSKAEFEQITGLTGDNVADINDLELEIGLVEPSSLETALNESAENNLSVIIAQYAQDAAESDVDSIWGELLPEVTLNAGWDKAYDPSSFTDEQTTEVIGITASIPLYQAGNIRSRLRQSKHTANQRQMDIVSAQREARQNTITAWQGLKSSQAEMVSRAEQINAAYTAMIGTKEEAELGERTVLDVLDATQEHLDSQVNLIIAKRNEVVAKFTMASALGALTADHLFDNQ